MFTSTTGKWNLTATITGQASNFLFFHLVFTFLTTNSDNIRGYATQNLVGGIAFNAPNKFDLAVIWSNFANGCVITQYTSKLIRIF